MASQTHKTLAQQLKQLNSEDQPTSVDVDSAYSSIEAHGQREVEREHYLDVGPSKLRREVDSAGLGERYEGKRVGRMKIFEDDDEDDEEADEDEEEDEEDEDEEEDEDDDEDEEGDEEEEEDEEDEEAAGEDDEDGQEEEAPLQQSITAKSSRALDPLSSLREARLKDIEKGKAIRRQKTLFESILTLRITFQKALIASSSIPQPFAPEQDEDILEKKEAALQILSELSDTLFQLREGITLPGVELGKRKRGVDDDVTSEQYWQESGRQALEMVDATRGQMLPILNKWSTKIQAASIQVGGKQGSSKFLQSTKGGTGIIEAIEAGLASKRDSDKTLLESEEAGYRALLREVIEARSGGSSTGIDLTHLRKEKKKKREAERGGSKGRKLRYTVHDKAQNFTVAAELPGGWHDEQIDELFSSLLGGAGIRGATTQKSVIPGGTGSGIADGSEGGLASLGGLRVF